jgi:hypothetical protein
VPRFGRRSDERRSGERANNERRGGERIWEVALGVARVELASAGDAVGVLDIEVRSPGAPEAAESRFDAALRAFMEASERLERATGIRDLVPVGEALEQTRYEIACVRALLQGDDAPERSAPCLFHPAHGPSVQEVGWGSDDHLVPACAQDARRVADGEPPDVRLIALSDRPAYYWDVPAGYGALIEGYYSRFGGAGRLAELLAGTPLGQALRPAG